MMQTFKSRQSYEDVVDSLKKADEDFWNCVELNQDEGTLTLRRNTLWKGGPLWSFQGQLATTEGGTELHGEFHCRTGSLAMPYMFVAPVLALVVVPKVGFSFNLLIVFGYLCVALLPLTGLRCGRPCASAEVSWGSSSKLDFADGPHAAVQYTRG